MPCKGYSGISLVWVFWAKKIWIRFKWTRMFSKTESFKTCRYVQPRPQGFSLKKEKALGTRLRYVRTKAKQKDKQIACEHPPSPLRKHPKRGSSDFSEGGGRGCCTQASKQIDFNGVREGWSILPLWLQIHALEFHAFACYWVSSGGSLQDIIHASLPPLLFFSFHVG